MGRNILLSLALVLVLVLTACNGAGQEPPQEPVSSETVQSAPGSSAENDSADISQPTSAPEKAEQEEPTVNQTKKVRFLADGNEIIVELEKNPAADALYELLPMELTFEDFNGVEKIAYPSETLDIAGAPDSCDPDVGDLCFYAPWGNLSFFYQDFRYSESLVPLGSVESGLEFLESLDTAATVTVEAAE